MFQNTELLNEIIQWPHERKRADGFETDVHEKAKEHGHYKGYHLVGCDARRENPDAYKRCGQKQQSQVRAPGSTHINVSRRIAERINTEHIYQRWQQR